MELERRRRRQRCNEPKETVDAEDARSIHDFQDDLLWLILLLLDSPLWLLRAASVCKRWRRIVAGTDGGRAFLHLANSLHAPAIVGHYTSITGGGRRFVLSSPPASIDGSRFSLDFIPGDLPGTIPIKNWEVTDCHGGLVLLHDRHAFMSDFVVCDPLTRRYHGIRHPPYLLPPVPAGLLRFTKIFLIDGDNGNTSLSNFQVLYRAVHSNGRFSHIYLFSMVGGSGNWRLLRQHSKPDPDNCYRDGEGCVAGRVDRSLYLGSENGMVTVFDNAKMGFSKVDLPSQVERSGRYSPRSTFAVVHGAVAGPDPGPDPSLPSPPVACIVHVHGEKLELFRLVRGSGDWVLKHSIPKLSTATRTLPGYPNDEECVRWPPVEIIAGGHGFAVLSVWISGRGTTWQFSFNVDTLELQSVSNETAASYRWTKVISASAYTLPWPQFLQACPS